MLVYGGMRAESSPTASNGTTGAETRSAIRTETESPTPTETKTPTETPTPTTWRLESLNRTTLSSPAGGFAEGVIRADGKYAAIGTRFSNQGSYLLDMRDPASPEVVHHLSTDDGERCLDVKFGPEKGLYCRTNHPAGSTGVEIVDYGFGKGTPRSPTVLGALDTGSTHNFYVSAATDVAYPVNYSENPDEGGIDVWDVSNPRTPRQHGSAGPSGQVHDVVYDAKRELLHCTYMGNMVNGYLILDASDPLNPTEIGRFDYGTHLAYEDADVGEEAFGNAHYALPETRRDLVIVGDERSYGTPGGKHVFDIGWRDGSPENPIPVGFTVSPNAEVMNSDSNGDGETDQLERFDWTGHQFDIVPFEDATLLTSGDWHEGTVLYDITDPTNPHPIDTHRTDEPAVKNPSEDLQVFGDPPMAYSSDYCESQGFAMTSDLLTGIYTYRIDGVTDGGERNDTTAPEPPTPNANSTGQ